MPVFDLPAISTSSLDGVEIKRFGAYLKIHPNLHKAHGHSFYHLVLFTAGGGSHTIDFDSFPVRAGQFYFMIPGQVHSWNFSGETDGYVINFSASFFASFLNRNTYLADFPFFRGSASAGVVQLDEAVLNEVTALMEKLLQANEHTAAHGRDYIRVLLLQVFIRIAQENASPETAKLTGRQLVLHQFLRLVDREYLRLRHPKAYAGELYITPNHLNALCRDMLGKPAGEVIRERVVLEAKRLLVNRELSVAGIGYTLGFKDNSYFTRFFRKQTGSTPEQFRKDKMQPHER
ncbi:MAG: helix-turn-helix domain-containing protein [Mucilaginibacter polytrichastri]|nr:helix-turn-helix domain-containing protein [Mucilaginibacter polytrichastri]